jgi:N-6 DNA Methylase
MPALASDLRRQLEHVIIQAREMDEAAACAALKRLAVDAARPFDHFSEAQRQLRNRLRARARQAGDQRHPNGGQEIEQLTQELAYEYWHRMLFARFLAENNLLMHPDGVAVSLADCEDLAQTEGAENGWVLAARYASRMLPQIFRTDDVLLEIEFPINDRLPLEKLLATLPQETFTADDSLGWVYQFWQAKKKDEVNASEVKIGAQELPAVTQLFTEPYMVAFLLDNSLGAWWAARRLTEADLKDAGSEDELRTKAALPGVPLKYLRFVKQDDGNWTLAAGTFDGWPKHLGDLKTLDPCCGSGHFLVAALLMLVPMRMEMEGLSACEAMDAVLRDNLHGLELDQRCVELAAFALALTAWRYPGAGGYRLLPELHLACSGLSVSAAKDEWQQLALDRHNLRLALEWMYEVFQDAPVLGSLLNPAKTDAAKIVQWEELSKALQQALTQEQTDEQHEAAVVAQGLAKSAQLLAGQYHLVVTNVPYLARGKQSDTLRDFCEKHYAAAKNDLATVFLDRCLQLCADRGSVSLVLPQNWMFLSSYKKFREKLLQNDTWHLLARLGEGGFDSSAAAGAFTVLIILSRGKSGSGFQPLFHANKSPEGSSIIVGLDVSAPRTAAEKAGQLITTAMKSVEQAKQLENPDARVALDESDEGKLLKTFARDSSGVLTSDGDRFYRCFWEVSQKGKAWEFLQGTVTGTIDFGGMDQIILWEQGKGSLYRLAESVKHLNHAAQNWRRGQEVWGQYGVAVSSMRTLPCAFYTGTHFDNNTAVIVPYDPAHLPAIWCFCSSPEYNEAVRQIDQSLKVTNATLVKVPFELAHWTTVAHAKYPSGLPKPYSDDPTQWIYHGHPAQSNEPLQVAVARLLGYRWPAEQDSSMELSDDARAWVEKSETLLAHADRDGIVCIPAVRGERPTAERLLDILRTAYGSQWSDAILHKLLIDAGCSPAMSLDDWLRDKFFEQHCKQFHHRPFIWHIWDSRKDGFSCLVNSHKLDHQRLETLTYAYLQDWIMAQAAAARDGKPGADLRLAAAQELQNKLKLILEGEPPYDIFVRWKPIRDQPIGWNPDLNDGVRVNIRPFVMANILRKPPNIKWTKDRGKEPERDPEQFSWFWKNGAFTGDRINDVHLTNTQKRAARERMNSGNGG